MAYPLATFEATLRDRTTLLLQLALKATSAAGSAAPNPDFRDAIRYALLRLGYPLADPAVLAVSDADLATVAAADLPRLEDVAELRLLENLLGSLLASPTQQTMQSRREYSETIRQLRETIAWKRQQLTEDYGSEAVGRMEVAPLSTRYRDPYGRTPDWYVAAKPAQ